MDEVDAFVARSGQGQRWTKKDMKALAAIYDKCGGELTGDIQKLLTAKFPNRTLDAIKKKWYTLKSRADAPSQEMGGIIESLFQLILIRK